VPKPYVEYTDRMNFKERLMNTIFTHIEDLVYGQLIKKNQRQLYEKHFPNAKRSFDDIYKSSAIIFTNTHIASSTARPFLPNFVEIGGIHVQPAKPLPKDIQEFLDSGTDGAIIFSMGSVIQSHQWPVEMREAFVKVFGKLKQKVIWKYENDTLPNKPDNVMISSWVPQRDIMAHKNVKFFITHGGLLGTTEALVEGIPVLGLPIFGDQKMNMAKAVTRGYGLQVYFDDISEASVGSAINELLKNPKYKENAKIISKRFNDRPLTPQQSVTYWTEYAHRHDGAPHLKAAGNDLNFIAFHMIDVYAVLLAIALVNFYIDYLVLKWLFRKCCGKSKKQDKKVKKN
jgi:glucuronosyltransferase